MAMIHLVAFFVTLILLANNSWADEELNGIADLAVNYSFTLSSEQLENEDPNRLFGINGGASSIVYELYTRKNPSTYEALKSTKDSYYFIPGRPLMVLIHGWLSQGQTLDDVKDAYLSVSDVNIIIVNWGAIAKDLYAFAAPQTRFVGEHVGELVLSMINRESHALNGSMVYFVGHSLGAHISGYAGRYLKNNVAPVRRITGLDPARPLFEVPRFIGGLDRYDADFVEVVHTNAGALGIAKPRGHVDFYVNGGGPVQPGCIAINAACSHNRSIKYFAESVRSGGFTGTQCYSSSSYNGQLCKNNNKQCMGDATDENAQGSYYTFTNPSSPYSRG